MAECYLASWIFSALALLLLLRLAVARVQIIEWSVQGVAPYNGTTLNVSFGDSLTFVCQDDSFSNVIIQPDRAQFDACDSRVTNGTTNNVVECVGVLFESTFPIRRQSDLPSAVQLVEGEDFFFTSYSDGTDGSQLNSVTHGGECLLGLKLAMHVNVQVTTDPTDTTDPIDTSNGIMPDPTTTVATAAATVTRSPPTTSSGGLQSSVTTTAIIGIIVGVVGGGGAVCCIVIVCVLCCLKKRGGSEKVTPSTISLADGQGNCEKGQDGVQLKKVQKVISHPQNGNLVNQSPCVLDVEAPPPPYSSVVSPAGFTSPAEKKGKGQPANNVDSKQPNRDKSTALTRPADTKPAGKVAAVDGGNKPVARSKLGSVSDERRPPAPAPPRARITTPPDETRPPAPAPPRERVTTSPDETRLPAPAPPRARVTTSPPATQGKRNTPPKQDQIDAPAKQTISTREKPTASPRALRRKPPTPPATNLPGPTQRRKAPVVPSNVQERRSSQSPSREEDSLKTRAGKSATPLQDSNARQSPKPALANQRERYTQSPARVDGKTPLAPKAETPTKIPQKPAPPPLKPSITVRGPKQEARVTKSAQDVAASRLEPLKPVRPNASVGVTSHTVAPLKPSSQHSAVRSKTDVEGGTKGSAHVPRS